MDMALKVALLICRRNCLLSVVIGMVYDQHVFGLHVFGHVFFIVHPFPRRGDQRTHQ